MSKNISFIFGVSLIILIFLGAGFALAGRAVAAESADEFAAAKELINKGVSCQELSQDQMAQMGDYYMEQMMPGQAHKNMDQMLGGEGSESLKQMHILMARRWYCGDAVGMGMMGMMGGNLSSAANNNYSGGMMGNSFGSNYNRGYNMMGSGFGMMGLGTGFGWGGALVSVLSVVLLLVGIAAIVKYLVKK